MYVIVWEYRVRTNHISEFEAIYRTQGAWAKLFKKSTGYLGSELLRDKKQPRRYLTIDRWNSAEEYESFLSLWEKEYEALDARCERLTETETLLGKWDIIE